MAKHVAHPLLGYVFESRHHTATQLKTFKIVPTAAMSDVGHKYQEERLGPKPELPINIAVLALPDKGRATIGFVVCAVKLPATLHSFGAGFHLFSEIILIPSI